MRGLKDKVAIVTGGGQGIGKGIAFRLLEERMHVAILEKDPEAGEDAASELSLVGDVHFFPADVADEDSVKKAVRRTVETFGRLDALINNAGISDPVSGPVENLSLADWNRIIQTNLTGCFLCAKYSVPHLRKELGAIVNIASTRAFQSEPNTVAYSASKGGLVALTHALAVSLGPEIRVNCVSPGWIDGSGWKKGAGRSEQELRRVDHEQHPVGRVGRPQDIAGLVAFLVSEEAGFITGQNFIVDGGMTRKMIYAE